LNLANASGSIAMMRKQGPREFLLGICLTLLVGCAMFQKERGGLPLAGSWQNSMGTIWTFKDDGTFDADLNQNDKRDVWGTYKINGDQITLQRTGGLRVRGCDGKGIYKFEHAGDSLKFTLVRDDCKLRRKNVLTEWRAKR
jgi:hypothetical protein